MMTDDSTAEKATEPDLIEWLHDFVGPGSNGTNQAADLIESLREQLAEAQATIEKVRVATEDRVFAAIIAQMEASEKRFANATHPLTLEPNPKSEEFVRGYREGRFKVQHIRGVLESARILSAPSSTGGTDG